MFLLYNQKSESRTHLSGTPTTVLLKTYLSTKNILNIRLIMDISLNCVENVSQEYSQELHYDSDSQKQ